MVPPARANISDIHSKYSAVNSVAIRSLLSKPLRLGSYLAPLLIMAVDYIAVVMALTVAGYLRTNVIPSLFINLKPFNIGEVYIVYIIPLFYIIFLAFAGMYSKRLPFWQGTEYLLKISTFVTGLVVIMSYFSGATSNVSRIFILSTWILSFIFLSVSRYYVKNTLIKCGLWKKTVVMIGDRNHAEILLQSFAHDTHMGYKIIGLIEDKPEDHNPPCQHFAHLGSFDEIERIILNSAVEDVFITSLGLERKKLLELFYRVQPYVRNVYIVPDLLGLPISNITIEPLVDEKIMLLKIKNNLLSLPNRIVKRIFDIFLGILLFPTLLPVFLLIALLIKLDSPGPVLHKAKRIGKNGREFCCYKFRSMYIDSDIVLEKHLLNDLDAKREWELYAKLKDNDPRVTKVGRWIRKYSLDELPQIINVILGDMSLVGPRPYLPREKSSMGSYFGTILESTPGITGLWQVSGRNEIMFEGRMILDCWYVRNWSIWLDIVLLCKTVKVVLGKKGAY